MRNPRSTKSSSEPEPLRPARSIAFVLAALIAGSACAGCGYRVVGASVRAPSNWKTIAIPAFKNDTTRYRIEQRFTQSVTREFLRRTKYRVVQDPQAADAVLRGEVLSIEATPVLFNGTTGEVTAMLLTVRTKVQLTDTKSGKMVYSNADMVFRQEYQISSDVRSFFEESDPALGRMSRDLAAEIVSNVLEGF
ncbi:MAG TPA: LptE family protein [Candidatus Acidoferrales bacterium]|nr:LptE family protein [Candidatus Acidoferrales bacterium]